MKATDRVF